MTKQTPMDNNEKQSHYLFYNNCLFVRLLVSVFDSDMYHYDDDCSCRNVPTIYLWGVNLKVSQAFIIIIVHLFYSIFVLISLLFLFVLNIYKTNNMKMVCKFWFLFVSYHANFESTLWGNNTRQEAI